MKLDIDLDGNDAVAGKGNLPFLFFLPNPLEGRIEATGKLAVE